MNLDILPYPGFSGQTYWYEGRCPRSDEWLRLPRTAQAEAIARSWMQQLAADPQYSQEGKMYGVLLVEAADGQQWVLKAFSGLLNGKAVLEGWVPPIPGRDRVALAEATTLASLDAIKQELIALQHRPERQQYDALTQTFAAQLSELTRCHAQRKHDRHQQRHHLLQTLIGEPLTAALEQLDDQSRQDGIERRHLKQQREACLQPLKQTIDQIETRIRD